MKIIAFIPSRFDSTRFPGKPMALIAGKPMIQYVYRSAKSCAEIFEVYVATDDKRIFQCVCDFGGKAIMTKKGLSTGSDRIAEAAQKLGLSQDDLVVNIQGDQPVFPQPLISDLLSPFREDQGVLMSTLKRKFSDEREAENANHVKVVTDRDGFALFFSRAPIPFFRNGESKRTYYKHLGFYAFRMDFLRTFSTLPVGEIESSEKLEQLRALEWGYKIKVVETAFDSVEVDTPGDLKKVEKMVARIR